MKPGLYPGVLGRGLFAKIGKETGHLGIKIAGVSCKIWEICMILKKLQLGMGPVSGPCETRDKALETAEFSKKKELLKTLIISQR